MELRLTKRLCSLSLAASIVIRNLANQSIRAREADSPEVGHYVCMSCKERKCNFQSQNPGIRVIATSPGDATCRMSNGRCPFLFSKGYYKPKNYLNYLK